MFRYIKSTLVQLFDDLCLKEWVVEAARIALVNFIYFHSAEVCAMSKIYVKLQLSHRASPKMN